MLKLFLLAPCALAVLGLQTDLIGETKSGLVNGLYMETVNGRKFVGFLNVPYAKPPIGDLRFAPPKLPESWIGVRDATRDGNMCMQRDFLTNKIIGNEDCLYLNVFTPKGHTCRSKKLPVMVFIHGGAFTIGSGLSSMYGPQILMDHNIILVTINYRLGALGFLTTADFVVPGNNGLKDQSIALRWVRENIDKFGGNSESITVFGESVGGSSVHMHMMSPLSKGLFHAGISESGTALCQWAMTTPKEGLETTIKLAKLISCTTKTNFDMVSCLRKANATDILDHQKDFQEWLFFPYGVFMPTVEREHQGAFITDYPENLIKSGKVNEVPWIVGINSDEGCLMTPVLYSNKSRLQELDDNFEKYLPITMNFNKTSLNLKMRTIRKFYFEDKRLVKVHPQQIANMYTDGIWTHCFDKAINLHRKYLKMPIYAYMFEYKGATSYSQIDGVNNCGVSHEDELLYLFLTNINTNRTRSDTRVSELITNYWVNFATFYNPTPRRFPRRKFWQSVSTKNNEFLWIFNDKRVRMKRNLWPTRVKFWRNLHINE